MKNGIVDSVCGTSHRTMLAQNKRISMRFIRMIESHLDDCLALFSVIGVRR